MYLLLFAVTDTFSSWCNVAMTAQVREQEGVGSYVARRGVNASRLVLTHNRRIMTQKTLGSTYLWDEDKEYSDL